MALWRQGGVPGASVRALKRSMAKRRGDLGQPAKHMKVEPDDLRDDHVWVLAVLGQALHHRTEQRLREPCRAVQRLFHREHSGALRTLDLSPDLVEQHPRHPLAHFGPIRARLSLVMILRGARLAGDRQGGPGRSTARIVKRLFMADARGRGICGSPRAIDKVFKYSGTRIRLGEPSIY